MMNIRFPSDWVAAARDAFARLAENPWALFVVLLAFNTLSRPYYGITHDTRLYSGQVLNHLESGAYGDDLFFRYGSQDEYSLFSHLAVPVINLFGLALGFFLIYLVSKTLLIWGMMRLVQTLVPNRTASTLALLYCMVVTIHYAGLRMMNVHESFVTPRLLSIALVLIGLDLILRGRPIGSFAIIVFALAVHPLMAFGGLLVWVGYYSWKLFGFRKVAGAVFIAGAGVAAILAYEPFGKLCFGEMDDSWRLTIMHASPFNFPSVWARDDWWYLAIQLAIGAAVAWKYWNVDQEKARFVVVVIAVTCLGAIGTVLAEQLPYAMLLQGQPYRAMWMLAFLHIAFACWLFVEGSQHRFPPVQLAATALLAFLCFNDGLPVEMYFPIFVLPFLLLALRGLEREPRDAAWFTHSIQLSLIAGGVLWVVYKLVILARGLDALVELHAETRGLVEVFLKNTGPVTMCVVLAWILVRVGAPLSKRAVWLTGAACLLLQTAIFALPETDLYREYCTRYRGDLEDIRVTLNKERDPSQPLPTVYSNLGRLDYIWIDLHSKSYFDWWQAGGFMFRRDMAMEGQRRACLVAPFEVERYRKLKHEPSEGEKHSIGRFFNTDFDQVKLGEDDLARLCQEPGLDYIVIEQEFDGLFYSRHGRLYLYRCRHVRTALGLPEPRPDNAVATARRGP